MMFIGLSDLPYDNTVDTEETKTYQAQVVIFTAKAFLSNATLMEPETPFCGISDATCDQSLEMWALQHGVGMHLIYVVTN